MRYTQAAANTTGTAARAQKLPVINHSAAQDRTTVAAARQVGRLQYDHPDTLKTVKGTGATAPNKVGRFMVRLWLRVRGLPAALDSSPTFTRSSC